MTIHCIGVDFQCFCTFLNPTVDNVSSNRFSDRCTVHTSRKWFSPFLNKVLENVEYVVTNYRPVLNGEHSLTDEEVCKRLCVSKQTP